MRSNDGDTKSADSGEMGPHAQRFFFPTFPSYIVDEERWALRHHEEVHQHLLAAAHAEHEKIRQAAEEAYQIHEIELMTENLRLRALKEEEELKLRKGFYLEQERIKALQDAKVLEDLQAKALAEARIKQNEMAKQGAIETAKRKAAEEAKLRAEQLEAEAQKEAERQAQQQAKVSTANISTPPKTINSTQNPATTTTPQAPVPTALVQSQQLPLIQVESPYIPRFQRYVEIHKQLKILRQFMTKEANQNAALKKPMGEMRRQIKQCIGQLTEGRGTNKESLQKINTALNFALRSDITTKTDPHMFIYATGDSLPKPVDGAAHNGDLPLLFLYLMNILAKAIVGQFINEAGANPKLAEPVGIIAVQIFSNPLFCWRKESLIDILIAKMAVACPAVLGVIGDEKTEEGRARLGWIRQENGGWVSEQEHQLRMAGLGAGYASITLRDFSRMPDRKAPWGPPRYWEAIASIVSLSGDQATSTQYMVLRALIDTYEEKFIKLYGSAARAALKVALVDFPRRAKVTGAPVDSLRVLGMKLQKDYGLRLDF